MRPHDTSREAHDFQIQGYRRMSLAQKAERVGADRVAARAGGGMNESVAPTPANVAS